MTSTVRRTLLLGTACGAVVWAGCASGPPVAREFPMLPDGTRLAYWRTSTGSYGSGSARVDWQLQKASFAGRPMMANASPTAGTTYYDLDSHLTVATRNPAGVVTAVYDPPVGFIMPLEVGRRWTTQHTMTLPQANRKVPLEVRWEVEAYERITVRAGTFDTWRVLSTDSFGEVQRIWTNPPQSLGIVKRQLSRPASHPQGAGTLEGELIEVVRPR